MTKQLKGIMWTSTKQVLF